MHNSLGHTLESPVLSVVVPLYNEQAGLQYFHENLLLPELVKQNKSFEIIYVDDGSTDKTLEILHAISSQCSQVQVLSLSRNFGKEVATTAGIHYAQGGVTILLDGDGQHPPSLIHRFISEWENGAQVVVGVRTKNAKEGVIKKWGSKVFYALFNSTSGVDIVPRSTDFRLFDQEVREAFLQFPERQRITRALIDWLGFERSIVEFEAPARIAGEATYSIKQLFQLAINSYISLSLKPLYFFGWVGATITLISALLGITVFIEQFLLGDPLEFNFSGAALLSVFVAFLIGLVLMSQAMLAAYVAHIHGQTQGRPLFVINQQRSVITK